MTNKKRKRKARLSEVWVVECGCATDHIVGVEFTREAALDQALKWNCAEGQVSVVRYVPEARHG